jgi:fatty-acyl-CoA synthase
VGRPDKHAGEVPVAYVMPKPGARLDEDEIERYCRERITERAAIPKKVHVIESMPMTAVGKIFKPQLRYDAIKKVFESELERLSNLTESVKVTVQEDKTHGTIALIAVRPASGADEQKIRTHIDSILGRYTIRYEVSVADET